MKDLLIYLLTPLVEDINQIQISETDNNGTLEFTVQAPKSQMGHIIGKEGKVISSIRQLMRLRGISEKINVNLKLEEKLD